MDRKTKRRILFFLILAAGVLFFIAAGLPKLSLSAGMPLPEIEKNSGSLMIVDHQTGSFFPVNELMKVILFILLVCFLLILFIKMIQKVGWKDLRMILIFILLGSLGFSGILFFIFYFLPHSEAPLVSEIPLLPTVPPITSPLGPIPPLLLWVLGLFLAGLVVLLVFRILTIKNQEDQEGLLIELEALKAKEALQNGRDLKDVVTQCYQKMCIALKLEKKIEREESMTTGEFEKLLEAAGAPRKSVRELTRLFEAVRYGSWKPGSGEEQKAILCFEDIIRNFRGKNGGNDYEKN